MVTKPYGEMSEAEFEAELQTGWSLDAQKLMRSEREEDRRKAATPPAPASKASVDTGTLNQFVRFLGQRFAEERDRIAEQLREELRGELRQLRKTSHDHRDMLERQIDEKIRSRLVGLERELEAAKKEIEALRQAIEERKLRTIR
ncbi:hypothetical protein GOB10_18410 [Sinorhizobium meliloti]|uniref:hypothetical protein n=1 Tax=Rhizobium meliloti TaxID=382 RepID=UPI00299CE59D|nr:hypothetical protein [Sinorhizobium meliloti]MDW9897721.1 hypothetical protein [Sinorhizobium meliloti]MDX0345430.1 hypothetical protein [Sinorhizobium meliloti]MDX0856776.1 hypothetical protein [Sinorhizobium medicae]MDX1211761.1 hypothetical protein [Sinorhizobium medicae]